MNTDQLIAKLDELIAATRSAAIPANMRWLSAESMAAMLDVAASVRRAAGVQAGVSEAGARRSSALERGRGARVDAGAAG